VAARLSRDLVHLLDEGLEVLTIGHPLTVKCGVFRCQPSGDGFALFFPRELKIRAVPPGTVAGAGAVGLATGHPSLDQASFTDKAHFAQARFELSILRAAPTKLLSLLLIYFFFIAIPNVYQ
jgi:hypothetical protein